MKLSRRRFISNAFAGGAISVFGDVLYLEPSWLKISRVNIPVAPTLLRKPLRILHLSDFHLSSVPLSLINTAIEIGIKEEPDLVCLTGDFISEKPDIRLYGEVLKKLSDYCPTFAVKGNHEGGVWALNAGHGPADTVWLEDLLNDCGIRLLENSGEVFNIAGSVIYLSGVTDLWSEPIVVAETFAGFEPGTLSIVMAHNPDSKEILKTAPWHLMLSGHTHGGQVIAPITGEAPFAPVKDKRFVRGLHEWEAKLLYITSGVGTLVGRFNCRPEVSILNLAPQVATDINPVI